MLLRRKREATRSPATAMVKQNATALGANSVSFPYKEPAVGDGTRE
jgi:hypothetical protein